MLEARVYINDLNILNTKFNGVTMKIFKIFFMMLIISYVQTNASQLVVSQNKDVKTAQENKFGMRVISAERAKEYKEIRAASPETICHLAQAIGDDQIEHGDFITLFSCQNPHLITTNNATCAQTINKHTLFTALSREIPTDSENDDAQDSPVAKRQIMTLDGENWQELDPLSLDPLSAACALTEENSSLVEHILETNDHTKNDFDANKNIFQALTFASNNRQPKTVAQILRSNKLPNDSVALVHAFFQAIAMGNIEIVEQFTNTRFKIDQIFKIPTGNNTKSAIIGWKDADPLSLATLHPPLLKHYLKKDTERKLDVKKRIMYVFNHLYHHAENQTTDTEEFYNLIQSLIALLEHCTKYDSKMNCNVLDADIINELQNKHFIIPIIDSITPVMFAASIMNKEIAHALLKCLLRDPMHKQTINIQNKYKKTALHYSTVLCHTKVLQLLIDSGGLLHIKDESGDDVLMNAIYNYLYHENIDAINLILAGTSIETRNNSKYTPIMYAVIWTCKPELVRYLIQRGANVFALDYAKFDAYYYSINRVGPSSFETLAKRNQRYTKEQYEKMNSEVKSILFARMKATSAQNVTAAQDSKSKKSKKKKSKK